MAIRVACSHCGSREAFDEADAGRTLACNRCGESVRVPDDDAGVHEGAPPSKRRGGYDDDDDRRSRDRDRDRDRMRRRRDVPPSNTNTVILISVAAMVLLMCLGGAASSFVFFLFAEEQEIAIQPMEPMPDIVFERPDDDLKVPIGFEAPRPFDHLPDGKAHADREERIVNGDFEQGRVGFRTQYTFSPGNLRPELAYDIVQRPTEAHADAAAFGDHTTGKGNMLMVNGGQAINHVVWGQTTTVRPGGEYTFTLWVASWTPISPAQLDVRVNGKSIGQVAASPNPGQWNQLRVVWNAGDNRSANIEIFDLNQAFSGNDFAIDDVSLRGPAPE
jgi:hypothetical protein